MNKTILTWKNSGNYFQYENYNTFYLQKGSGEDLLIIHSYHLAKVVLYWVKVILFC